MPNYDWASTRKWLLEQKRADPDAPKLRFANDRYRHAPDLFAGRRIDFSRLGRVNSRLDRRTGRLSVRIENVGKSTFYPSDAHKSLVVNDGEPFDLSSSTRVDFEIVDGQAKISENADLALIGIAAEGPPSKTLGPSGPIWDVWCEPVVYVYDTPQDADVAERLKQSAAKSAEWDMTFGDESLLVVSADELTDQLKRGSHVILFAAGEGKLRGSIDVPWPTDKDAKQRIDDADVRVALRPAPWNRFRYVLVVDILADRPVSLHEFGWWDDAFWTDWVVGRARKGRRGVGVLAAGFFDADWQPAACTVQDTRGPSVLRFGNH
jgi:hypothetical protein